MSTANLGLWCYSGERYDDRGSLATPRQRHLARQADIPMVERRRNPQNATVSGGPALRARARSSQRYPHEHPASDRRAGPCPRKPQRATGTVVQAR